MYHICGRTGFVGYGKPVQDVWQAFPYHSADDAHASAKGRLLLPHYKVVEVVSDIHNGVCRAPVSTADRAEVLLEYLLENYNDSQWDAETRKLMEALNDHLNLEPIQWEDFNDY